MPVKDMVDEIVEDEVQTEDDLENSAPRPTDPEWVDYVIDNLADRELFNGAPTTDGLRRVTELIFGEIIKSDTEVLEVPKVAYKGKATAKHTLVIEKYSGGIIEVSACVDVIAEKLPYPFNEHVVSTACTRAEGKALRRALKIRVQTAEELNNTEDYEEDVQNDNINDQQIMAIKTLCKRLDVNLSKFVKQSNTNKKYKTINDVSNVEARLLIGTLSGYQREGTPKELQGFENSDAKFLGE